MNDGRPLAIGNPYARILHPSPCCNEMNSWSRIGFRRGFSRYPWYVDAKSGHIVVSERDGHRLQLFDLMGSETKYQPQGCHGFGMNQFISPGGVTTTSLTGANVIVADSGNRRIVFMRKSCDYQGNGMLELNHEFGQQIFRHPLGIEYDRTRDFLMVTDTVCNRVTLNDMRTGMTVGEMRQPKHTPLLQPVDVAVDSTGCTYVTDGAGGCVHMYDKNGNFVTKFGEVNGLRKPWGICFDRQKNLLVTDEDRGQLIMYKERGEFNRVVSSDLYVPKGVSVNQYEMAVVATGDPYNFLKIIQYK